NATLSEQWPDPNLKTLLMSQRQTLDEIYPKAVELEPGITREQLHQRLRAAVAEGFAGSFPRRYKVYWALRKGNDKLRGAMTFQLDDHPVYKLFITEAHRGQPVSFDRF